MAQYKYGNYIVKDGEIYEVQIDIPRMMGAEVIHVALKDFKKQTNGDRIRQMTDEKLAEFFYKHMNCNSCCVDECVTMLNDTTLVLRPCELRILDWLRKEAEDGH